MPGFGLFPVDSLERYSKIHEHHFQAVKNHWFIEDYIYILPGRSIELLSTSQNYIFFKMYFKISAAK